MTADEQVEARAKDALAAGDEDAALTLWMKAYADRIYRFCFRMLRDPGDAEDATQVTFIQAFEGLSRFKGESKAKTWLFSIALNRCKDMRKGRERRRQGVASTGTDESADSGPSAEKRLAMQDDASIACECLTELEPEHRTLLLLRYTEGFSCEEIAAMTGDGADRVRGVVYRAMKRLQECAKRKGEALEPRRQAK
jgi:RNA polymerase sigma-70 factor (ECF subfamily)